MDRFEHLKSLEDTMLDHTSGVLDTLSDLQLTLYTALRPYAENYGADLFHEMNEQDVIARLERDSKAEREYLDRLEQRRESKESRCISGPLPHGRRRR